LWFEYSKQGGERHGVQPVAVKLLVGVFSHVIGRCLETTHKNQVIAVAKLMPMLLMYSGNASAEYCRKRGM
jgi:hypothetical protein